MSGQGYSENSREIELGVGHVAGLRWFNLASAVPCSSGGGRVTVEHSMAGPPKMACSCGSVLIALPGNGDGRQWLEDHREGKGRKEAFLRGTYGKWAPGENVATHAFTPTLTHSSPPYTSKGEEDCHCGFWAYWTLGRIPVLNPAVPAIIHGYGHVIDGELGFRSSHAALKAVVIATDDPELQLAVEDKYGIPVYATVEAMLAMHEIPEDQPPLDAGGWTTRKIRLSSGITLNYGLGAGGYASGGAVTGAGGGSGAVVGSASPGASGGGGGSVNPVIYGNDAGWRPGESVQAYAARAGFTGSRCRNCGASAQGSYCMPCYAAQARTLSESAQALAESAAKTTAAVRALAELTPLDALAQLDKRKAGWAPLTRTRPRMSGKAASLIACDEAGPPMTATVGKAGMTIDPSGALKSADFRPLKDDAIADAIAEPAPPADWAAEKPYAGGAGGDRPFAFLRDPLSVTAKLGLADPAGVAKAILKGITGT